MVARVALASQSNLEVSAGTHVSDLRFQGYSSTIGDTREEESSDRGIARNDVAEEKGIKVIFRVYDLFSECFL